MTISGTVSCWKQAVKMGQTHCILINNHQLMAVLSSLPRVSMKKSQFSLVEFSAELNVSAIVAAHILFQVWVARIRMNAIQFCRAVHSLTTDTAIIPRTMNVWYSVVSPGLCARGGGHGVGVHEIRNKSHTFLHQYNKLTLSRLKRLWICGWNWKMCDVH